VPPLRVRRNEHDFTVQVFWDSDIGKWIEAASYTLARRRDRTSRARVEAIVDDLDAQAPRRGPLVYCLEEHDNPGRPVQDLRLPRGAALAAGDSPLFGGIVALTPDGLRLEGGDWGNTLYRSEPPSASPARLTALPYFLWNDRGRTSMAVWVPEI
jgi:DUF1680 family protein